MLSSFLLGLFLLSLIEYSSQPIVWTLVFMLLHVFVNSEDIASAPSSSTQINENFLYWFLNVVTIHLGMSVGGILIMYGNPKGYEVAEHISTKFEVNLQMLSTLKYAKSIWSMKPGANFDTSMVIPMLIFVALVRRQIGQGYSKSGIFYGRPFMITFLVISLSLILILVQTPCPNGIHVVGWWCSTPCTEAKETLDGVHPKTSPFSTRHLFWVNYKVVSQLFHLI